MYPAPPAIKTFIPGAYRWRHPAETDIRHACHTSERPNDMVAPAMSPGLNAVSLFLVLNGHGQRTVVSVMPRGLYRSAVAAGTGPAGASYDVDAAMVHAVVGTA